MIFDILTLFPGMFASPFQASIIGKAMERRLIQVRVHNIRDYATDKHRMTDDRPFGGGEGMVMKPEPIVRGLHTLHQEHPPPRVILLTPQGRVFDQGLARELGGFPRLVLICGRYEGVDERIARYFVDDEISVGDYILTGGELAAMILVEAVARLIPGVLGNVASPHSESFGETPLKYPQYTRPQEFLGYAVPEVLLSGNHQAIRRWRRGQALLRTRLRRPDLFARLQLNAEDQELLSLTREQFSKEAGELRIEPTEREEPAVYGLGPLPGGEPQ
jgi:tRNA (guanine37-N1)-methyltransferase